MEIDTALADHERGRFQEARVHFATAHRLRPSARTLRGLGKVEFELRNYGEAAAYFKKALTSQVSPLPTDLQREVSGLLQRCRTYLGQVHVHVQPGSATILVDGITVASGPHASLSLVVGDHLLELRALGRLPERRSIRIQPEQSTEIDVILSPTGDAAAGVERIVSVVSSPSPPVAPGPQHQEQRRRPAWVWVTVALAAGVVVAGVTVATVLGTRDKQETGALHDSNGAVVSGPIVHALGVFP
jgi:hypothetical protein